MKRIVTVIVVILVAGIIVTVLTLATNKKQTPSGNTGNTPNSSNSSGDSNANATQVQKITISSTGFSPQNVTVTKGTIVVWTNKDSVEHTVTSDDDNGPASTAFGTNLVYSFTFNTPGTYNYTSQQDSDFTGSVTVK